LLALACLQGPHWGLDLDRVGLQKVSTIVGRHERGVNEKGVYNDRLIFARETSLRLTVLPDVLKVTSLDVNSNKDLCLNIGGRLSTEGFVSRLFVVVESDAVVGEVIVIDGSFDEEGVPHDRLVISQISQLLLRESVRDDVVHVNEVSGLLAVSITLEREGKVGVLDLGLTRIDEAESLHSNSGRTSSRDKPGGGIDHVRIVESECDVVVGVVEAVEGHLYGQDIGLGVHRDLAADGSVLQ